MRTRRTFKDILAEVEQANSARVVARARLANRLAKAVERPVASQAASYAARRARRRCYELKTRALEHGIAAFPGHYELASVEEGGALIGVTWAHRACFHLPVDRLGARTAEWLARQRACVRERLAA